MPTCPRESFEEENLLRRKRRSFRAPAGTSESSVCASTGVVSQVLVRQEHGSETWQVWIGLDDEDPIEGPGFIIGLAATRDEAVAEAVADLQAAVATLQGPFLAPGTPDAQD